MSSTKEIILEEVNKMVHQQGFQNVTFSSIASKIGTSRENIHHHFKTKEKLGLLYIAYLEDFLNAYFLEIHQSSCGTLHKLKQYYALYRITQEPYVSCPLVSLLNEYQNLSPLMQSGIKNLIDIEYSHLKKILSSHKNYTEVEIKSIILLLKGAVLYEKTDELYFDDTLSLIENIWL